MAENSNNRMFLVIFDVNLSFAIRIIKRRSQLPVALQ